MENDGTVERNFQPPIIITGMSGSGLSTAAKVFEDKGFFVPQNLPPQLIVDMVKLATSKNSPVDKIAIVTDVRARMFQGSLLGTITDLKDFGYEPIILFLEARDDVLIKRFDGMRRTHPLQGDDPLSMGIQRERESIAPVRDQADIVIDTTNLSVHDLRRAIEASFGDVAEKKQHITIESFGFKHGSPPDADFMFDVRFLPNPYWIPELREFRGTDPQVSDYVLSQEDATSFVDKVTELIGSLLPGYRYQGKNFITIGIGCTGGHHRSVAISEELKRRLSQRGDVDVSVLHRDISRK
ncbi:RNase adapter RapZ [Corynebacterium lubricantis]|uniref:RNase adapter RapZ n=1 Tax=Corynebacterium lubricantis TaxID=541095 RepID=UPI00037AC0D2|nr:RNase adapter RapZ [Corynebacterium lubricantis]